MAFRCVLSGVNCQASTATPPQGVGGGPLTGAVVAVAAAANTCSKRQSVSPRIEGAKDVTRRLRLPLTGSIVAVNKLQKKSSPQRGIAVASGVAGGRILVRQHHLQLQQQQQQQLQQQHQITQQQQHSHQRTHQLRRQIATEGGVGGETVVQLFPARSSAAAIAPVAVVRYGRVGFAATAPPNVKDGDVFSTGSGDNRGPGTVNFVSGAGGRPGIVISTQSSPESEHAVTDTMGSVNKSVSLRLPPGAGSKRIFNVATSSPIVASTITSPATAAATTTAAAATTTTAAAAAALTTSTSTTNSLKSLSRVPTDHQSHFTQPQQQQLQQQTHVNHQRNPLVNGRGGDRGIHGGANGLKPLTNGKGTFTLVKRGGVISNGGKMVITSTNGNSNTALNENNHVREIFTSPSSYNGIGGTATVTAILPAPARMNSHQFTTTSTFMTSANNSNNSNSSNDRLKGSSSSSSSSGNNNNNSNTNNMNNTVKKMGLHTEKDEHVGELNASKTLTAVSGIMLPSNKKMTGSKTSILIGKSSSYETQEINGNHNYTMISVAKPLPTSSANVSMVEDSLSFSASKRAKATTTSAHSETATATTTTTRTASTTVAVAKQLLPANKAVHTRTVSSIERNEENHENTSGINDTKTPPGLRSTSSYSQIRSNANDGTPARTALTSSNASAQSLATSSLSFSSSLSSLSKTTVASTTVASSTTTTSTSVLPSTTEGRTARIATNGIAADSAECVAASVVTTECSSLEGESKDEDEIAKRKDELPSTAKVPERFSADPGHIFAVDCEAQLRKLHDLHRKNDAVTQRIHRIQTKSTVEVAYSELKQVVARGQDVFRMPCLMSKNGQIAAQLANKEKNGAPLIRKFSDFDSGKLVRGCGVHSTLIANSEMLCDSSATESSSEEEDLPEKSEIFNGKKILTPYQYASSYSSCTPQHPAWRWASERASLGARWTWLQAQVSELEYRIRQQHELCRQLRLRKEPCLQQPEPNHGPDEHSRCARSMSLNKNFSKRRLVVANTIPVETAESVPLDALNTSCECGSMYPQVEPCVRCTLLHAQSARERLDISEERQQEEFQLTRQLMAIPLWDSQSEISRMALYDETYHPVLSGRHDISLSLHYENLLRMGYSLLVHKNAVNESSAEASGAAGKRKKEQLSFGLQQQQLPQQHLMQLLQQQQSRSAAATPELSEADDDGPPVKRKRHSSHAANRPSRSEKRGNTGGTLRPPDNVSKKRRADRRFTTTSGRRSMSVDSQEQADDELFADIGDRSHQSRARRTSHVNQQECSYDIDNIVIPYGMMSSTRLVERLKYKEILTPKWRILHINPLEMTSKDGQQSAQVESTEKVSSTPSQEDNFAMDDEDTVLEVKDSEVEEDMSDANFEIRHGRQETLERERFSVYLQPKLLSNIGSPSTNTRGRPRTESTEAQKSKDVPAQAAASQPPTRAKEIPDESSLQESETGGKSETAKLHASKAKRQQRSLSQDWTMLQSSSAPTPYPTRSFPLSGEEIDKMLQENSDDVENGCETVSVDENISSKSKDKTRKSISKDSTSSATNVDGESPMTDKKLDDTLYSETLHDQQQQPHSVQTELRTKQQEETARSQHQESQNQKNDCDERSLLGRNANPISNRVTNNESLHVEENSEDKLALNKSEQNEDFEMADDNSTSNTSHRHDEPWLSVASDKVNVADIMDEIANPEWSADEDETEPED